MANINKKVTEASYRSSNDMVSHNLTTSDVNASDEPAISRYSLELSGQRTETDKNKHINDADSGTSSNIPESIASIRVDQLKAFERHEGTNSKFCGYIFCLP